MVDYSRFAHIGDDDDDDELPARPRVTRLDEGSKVVVGTEGWRVERKPRDSRLERKPRDSRLDYSRWDKLEVSDEEEEKVYYEDEARRRLEAERRPTKTEAPLAPRFGRVDEALDGSIGRRPDGSPLFAWTQTAEDVTVRFATTATRAAEARPRVSLSGRCCVLSIETFAANLAYDVWCENDARPSFRLADNDDHAADLRELDWELEDAPSSLQSRKCVRLTLRKRPPARDVVVWWSRVFEENQPRLVIETDIDTANLQGRLKRASKPDAFQTAWQDAHHMFRDKVARRDPPEKIDLREEDPS